MEDSHDSTVMVLVRLKLAARSVWPGRFAQNSSKFKSLLTRPQTPFRAFNVNAGGVLEDNPQWEREGGCSSLQRSVAFEKLV